MKSVWFTFRPSVYVIPLALAFFVYFLSYGTLYITYDYTQGILLSSFQNIPFYSAPPFSMTNADYSLLKGTRGIVSCLAMLLLIGLQRLKKNDYWFVSLALISVGIQYLFYGLSQNKILLFVGLFFGLAGKWYVPILRKLMADKVPEELAGSLFAIPAWIECGGRSIASILYTSLYKIDPFNAGWIFWGVSNALLVLSGNWTDA